MAESIRISDRTKNKMTELQGSAKALSSPAETIVPITPNNPTELLGQIYDLMLKQRTMDLQTKRNQINLQLEEKLEQQELDKLLLEKIGGKKTERKKPAPKVREKKPEGGGGRLGSLLAAGGLVAGVVTSGKGETEEPTTTPAPEPAPVPTVTPPAPEPEVTPSSAPSTAPITKEKKEEVKISAPVQKISGMDDVKAMVVRHEGKVNQPYKDSLGLWTVGVGHLIGDGKSLPPEWNRKFSDKEVMDLFEQDFAHHVKIAEKTPGYSKANDGGKAAFIDLSFNMGQWWPKWPNTSKKLNEADFEGAAEGLKDSKWYTQVKGRAKEIVALVSQAGGEQKTSMISPSVSSGTSLASSSETNKNLKDSIKKDKQAAMFAKNTTTNTINNVQTAQSQPEKYDDRPVWQKKSQAA